MKIISFAFVMLGLVALLAVVLGINSLMLNRLPWDQPPGFKERLGIYLTEHVAQTRAGHILPELEPHGYAQPPAVLFDAVAEAVRALRWRLESADSTAYRLHAVVTTPLLRFHDDVAVQVVTTAEGLSRLNVRSASRMGKADFGTNSRHILNLYQALADAGITPVDQPTPSTP